MFGKKLGLGLLGNEDVGVSRVTKVPVPVPSGYVDFERVERSREMTSLVHP